MRKPKLKRNQYWTLSYRVAAYELVSRGSAVNRYGNTPHGSPLQCISYYVDESKTTADQIAVRITLMPNDNRPYSVRYEEKEVIDIKIPVDLAIAIVYSKDFDNFCRTIEKTMAIS